MEKTEQVPTRHWTDEVGNRICGERIDGVPAFSPQYVSCRRCLDLLSSPAEIRLPTAAQQRSAVDSAERIGEAVVRIADAVRLVLPVITGAIVDIRAELRK